MKATAEETGGAFLLFEDLMAQGKTTPLHTHANEDETLYVLEGELLVHIDGSTMPSGRAASRSRRAGSRTRSSSPRRRRAC